MPRWLLKHSLAGSQQTAATCRIERLSLVRTARRSLPRTTMLSYTLVENNPAWCMYIHCAETGVDDGNRSCATYQDVPDVLGFGKAKHRKLNSPGPRLSAFRRGWIEHKGSFRLIPVCCRLSANHMLSQQLATGFHQEWFITDNTHPRLLSKYFPKLKASEQPSSEQF